MPAEQLLGNALAEAKRAYQFAPNSYTYGALTAILIAMMLMGVPDWIEEFTEYRNEPPRHCDV
jgi:hypothetical protein